MVNNILIFNNNNNIIATKPQIKFDINKSIELHNTLMDTLKVNDCDTPGILTYNIRKIESNSIRISYDIRKKYHISLNKDLLKISIEYSLIKNDNYLWNDYKQQDNDTSSDTDNDTESDTDSGTDSDTNSDTDSYTQSDDTDDDDDEDEGDIFKTKLSKKPKKKHIKKQKRKKKKHKKRKKNKIETPPTLSRLIDIGLIDGYNSLKWMIEEHKISSIKSKKSDKKCKIISNIKPDKTYIIRMKILNNSGWSDYSKQLYIIKTPKVIINSTILTLKEKVKLKKMVAKHTKHTNSKYSNCKWKLLYKGTKHGFLSNSFYNQCDKKRNIICVIHSNSNTVFGGFTSIGFDRSHSSGFKTLPDANAFLYLIRSNNEKLYKPRICPVDKNNINGAVGHQSGFFLMFGSGADGIYCADNCNTSGFSEVRSNCRTYPTAKGSYLNCGKNTFTVKEIEVFQLK